MHTSLGLLYDRIGESKLADKHFREALRLAPDKPDVVEQLRDLPVQERTHRRGRRSFHGRGRQPLLPHARSRAHQCRRLPALRQASRRGRSRSSSAPSRRGLTTARPPCSSPACTWSASEIAEARKVVDTYLNAFKPKPDVLLVGGDRGARRQGQDVRGKIFACPAPGLSGLCAGARAQATLSRCPRRQHLRRAAPRSIGERLRAGRERAGLSVAAAAEKLHLDPKVIEALEADRFAELGASVYVRGHLRRYADFVGEPGVEMVNAYSDARSAAAAARSHAGAAPRAARRSAPAGDAAGGAGLRRGAGVRHLVGSGWLASAMPIRVLPRQAAKRPAAAAPATRRAATAPRACRAGRPAIPCNARRRRRRRRSRSRRPPPPRQEAAPARPTQPAAGAEQRELGRGLRFARRTAVLRRGQRRQRAEHRRAAAVARGAGQRRRGVRPGRRPGARNSRQCRRMAKARVSS